MKSVRVLHLEDSRLDAELIAASLANSQLGLTLQRVETRDQFVHLLQAEHWDLILADFSLPHFDGATALQIARELKPLVPFIFVSGALGEELAIEMLKSGATDYVLKHRLERLDSAIERALREANERQERRRAEESLRESEERFRLLVESTDDYAIIMLDSIGKVISWNPGAERTLGYTTEEAIGQPFEIFFTPEDRANGRPARELNEAAETGRAADENYLLRKDGQQFWASGVSVSLRDDEDRLRGFAKILRDLSHRKRLEEQLKQRAEQLADADRRKDNFLAMLGHELRNPLAPIRNAAEVMQRRGLSDPTLRWIHDVIERQAAHLSRLVDDLLDIARINTNKIKLRVERLNLLTAVRQAMEAARPLIEARKHNLRASIPDKGIWLDADLTRLTQIFFNLLNNAAKYTDDGGNISIVVNEAQPLGLRGEPGEVVITVRDNGMGIAPHLLSRVFEPFIQADTSLARTEGGLGIGLTLVHQLTTMHGGHVEAHSAGPGKGSEFVVHLPTRPSPDEPEIRPEPTRTAGRSILVVDDSVDGAMSLAMLLQLSGHEVRAVHDGMAALQTVKAQPPEVVILDIGLPQMDGYEVAKRLRSAPGGQKLYLIALTGYGQAEDKQRAAEAGFDSHQVKPVDPESLLRLISEAPRR